LLVLDATIGQNSISQAKLFHEAMELDGLVMTKLDGTAKGGVLLNLSGELKLPVYFIGVGEKADDLQIFDPKNFVEALISG
jgi:fused signal recognition particle receptor